MSPNGRAGLRRHGILPVDGRQEAVVGRLDGVPPSIAAFCHAGLGAALTCCDIVEKESLCSRHSTGRRRARRTRKMGLNNAKATVDVLPKLDKIRSLILLQQA